MKSKKLSIAAFLLLSTLFSALNAQTIAGVEKPKNTNKPSISDYLKISGNLDLQYDYESSEENNGDKDETSTFNMRRARLVFAGDITPKFEFKLQVEMAGKSPKVLDAFAKWKLYDEFQIRIGQGKIPFTIENPYAPSYLTIENTMVINALSGMADDKLCPKTSFSGGREMGVSFMGGFIKKDGFKVINYEVGVFNGNGINDKNDNKQMAYVGQIEIKPIKDLKIHGSAYLGSYKTETEADAERNRFAVGAEYASTGLMVRSEYVWGTTDTEKDAQLVNQKSDGFYAQAAYNINIKCKGGKTQTLIPVIRYENYTADCDIDDTSTYYLVGLGWWPEKHFRLQLNYTIKDKDGYDNLGHLVAAQATVKF